MAQTQGATSQHHVVIISIDFLSEATFSSASRRSGVIKAGTVKVGRLATTPAKTLAKVSGVLSTPCCRAW